MHSKSEREHFWRAALFYVHQFPSSILILIVMFFSFVFYIGCNLSDKLYHHQAQNINDYSSLKNMVIPILYTGAIIVVYPTCMLCKSGSADC